MNTRDIQLALASLGINPGIVDGKSGPKTKAAIRAFQAKYGLVVDGIAGRQTQAALKQAITPIKPGRPEPDKSAMTQPPPAAVSTGMVTAAAPPNVASLVLLDTARAIDEVWIHCTATPEGKDYTVADITAWHKARGFNGCGYHYIVYRDGRVMLGRPVGQIGSHVAGHNTGSIGISYVGGVTANGKTPKDTRTAAQRASLLWLTNALVKKHRAKRVRGHNEVAAKACPSFTVLADPLGKIAA